MAPKTSSDDQQSAKSATANHSLVPPGEEVVITGMAGKFPDSDGVYEFRDNLFNKVNMVSGDDRRWKLEHSEIPQKTGKIKNISKFDAGYFGIHYRAANNMDPMVRVFLQSAVECILDAGYHPKDLEGSNTGVYVGACFSESERNTFYVNLKPQQFGITGCIRSMIANRVSYYLKLKGPSFIVDTACSSSLYALEQAYKSISNGDIDSAIVGGSHVCLHPVASLQFMRLGVLSADGSCKVFDQDANGYARSEAIACVFLQRAKNANRIYGTVVHAKTNCDGFKEQGITFPSSQRQKELLGEFYDECKVSTQCLSYIEAHGTGTSVGDPEEVAAIDEILSKGRKTPLYIGSVKSNIGHSEPSAGICSLVKCLIALETGYIPPNINFNKPKETMPALMEGRLRVVTEKTPITDDHGLIAIDSFGFGGGNAHVLLEQNKKKKNNNALPSDDLPRLVCVSGRTEEAVLSILNDVAGRPLDAEYVWLFHQIFRKTFDTHHYRGYTLVSKSNEITRSVDSCFSKQPLCVAFHPLDDLKHVASHLFRLPLFAGFVQRMHEIMLKKEVNITDALFNKNNVGVSALSNATLQLGILELFKELEIEVEDVTGCQETVKAYFNNSVSLEEALSSAFSASKLENGTTNERIKSDLETFASEKNLLNSRIVEEIYPEASSPINALNKTVTGPLILEIGDKGTGRLQLNSKGDILVNFLEVLGRLYLHGYNPQLERLYPRVNLPLSRGTPMISPLIKWRHDEDRFFCKFVCSTNLHAGEEVISVTLKDSEWTFVQGHVVDGRNLFPATGYLTIAWQTLANSQNIEKAIEDTRVVFENVRFHRATTVPKEGVMELLVMVQRGSGNFEINEGGSVVVSGRIFFVECLMEYQACLPLPTGIAKEKATFLKTKDIYKELRLRGYNYKGAFRGLVECDSSACSGLVKWDGNWISFMDNMLQMKILQLDTRYLYVPTYVQRLTIDAIAHLKLVQSLGEDPKLSVYNIKECDLIKCGAIEVRGMNASSIPRRRPLGDPVLEKYVFVPNETSLSLNDSLKVIVQIILDNALVLRVKSVELVDEATQGELLSPILVQALEDLPLIQSEPTIFSKEPVEVKGINVENKKLISETDYLIVIGSKILQRVNILQQALGALGKNGFILSREPIDFATKLDGLDVIVTHSIGETEKLVLCRKPLNESKFLTINVDDEKYFNFLPKLQNALKTDDEVVLYSQKPLSGILGLTNCIRREPNGGKVRCIFLTDNSAPNFDPEHPFYKEILNKKLAGSVYKNGQWGTYRHLVLENINEVLSEHCYVNVTVRGDLSSLRWIEGSLTSQSILNPEQILVKNYYAALNFRDIMTASGRINADVITMDRLEQECVQGFEFSGRDLTGRRLMGLVVSGALSTLIAADPYLVFPVPDSWTLEEAATVPVVYCTVMYAFFVRASLKKGQTLLIHAGTGGIGLAAITLAIAHGCTVFTTVGTREKREFLLKKFPQLKESHIGNSRDVSFEWMIKRETDGRGVDIVLNSLAEEKLIASARCLAHGGCFLEIGKVDLANNNHLSLLLMKKEAQFHGIMLDQLFTETPTKKASFKEHMRKGLLNGDVRPLPTTVFKYNEVEQAFRYMATGKHIGKVLVAIRKEEKDRVTKPIMSLMKGQPRYHCDPDKVQIITGGLGGFGLELADWLILRGARTIVLTSRSGVKTGYQGLRIRTWKNYGVSITISKADITTKEGCKELLESASKLGKVESLFNLAVVLKDAILENQTQENFQISFGPKAYATEYLDELTRELCPDLRDFVIFSSVSCGRGNAGQTNYGMANSVMERLCEKRRAEGYPALAVEWGAIGEVGLVAEMQEENFELEIGGTLQQRISSCLEVMDKFLRQKNPIVSSMVVAEKRAGAGGADNVVDAVANILGIRDLKTVSHHSTLAELGMDSMTAVEIKTTLEREFEVFLTPQDIRRMTFARLFEIREEMEAGEGKLKKGPAGLEMLLRYMPDLNDYKTTVIQLVSNAQGKATKVFVLPGFEGTIKVMQPLVNNLNVHAIGLQYDLEDNNDTIEDIARGLIPLFENHLESNEKFHILCYSFGGNVGLEVTRMLEERGHEGLLFIIDGAPELMKQILSQNYPVENDVILETSLLCQNMSFVLPPEKILGARDRLIMAPSWEERMLIAQEVAKSDVLPAEFQRMVATALYKRIKSIPKYKPQYKIQSTIHLYKPTIPTANDMANDYNLTALSKGLLDIKVFEGDHMTLLENLDLANSINTTLGMDIVSKKD